MRAMPIHEVKRTLTTHSTRKFLVGVRVINGSVRCLAKLERDIYRATSLRLAAATLWVHGDSVGSWGSGEIRFMASWKREVISVRIQSQS